MRALISVSNKKDIVWFSEELSKLGYEIISTGGTLRELNSNGIKAIDVSKITNSPEMFDGRVKTLHPNIHGGILYRRDNDSDVEHAKSAGIKPIDLLVVNLYPFKETINRTDNFEEIIENIDIGGPTMVRAAAKNFKDVLIVTDVNDYGCVIEALKDGKNDYEFRKSFMIKAYEHTAEYDATIANYMNRRFHGGFGQKQFITGTKVFDTRYGENPHQSGSLYQFEEFFNEHFIQLKGEASFNNLTDLNSAVKIAASFKKGAISIIKHGNPCGFAQKDSALESYKEALKCDPISAYGGVVAVNGVVDKTLAQEINKTYIEVLIAGDIDEDALAVFEAKKRIKIFKQNSDTLSIPKDAFDFKHIEGGFVYQNSDIVLNSEIDDAKCVSTLEANSEQFEDLRIAYKLAALTKSNCVTYVKNGALVAIGMGMTSRVDAASCALQKAKSLNLDVDGASLASEAFFPFRDSIDAAAKAGVKAIIQPGGSIRDEEVIEAANEHKIALYLSGIRHFLH